MHRNIKTAATSIKKLKNIHHLLVWENTVGSEMSLYKLFNKKEIAKLFMRADGDPEEIVRYINKFFSEVPVEVGKERTVIRNIFALYETTLK